MDLNEFVETQLSEEDIEGGSSLGRMPSKKSLGYNKMINVLLGNERFEGEIKTPEDFKAVIDAILGDKVKVKPSMKAQAKEIDKIIKKIEKGRKITKEEEEKADDFADDVEEFLFSETYVKRYTAQSQGGSGGTANKARFSDSVPVKYTTDTGKEYYGLITPPTGFIAWQSQDVYKIVKNDPEIDIPPRLELISGEFKVARNRQATDLIASGRFAFDDNKETKKRVEDAFKKHGAEINQKGELPGIEKVVKKVEFWKDIASIF